MPATAEVRIYNASGVKQATVTLTGSKGLLNLSWLKVRNGIDLAQFQVDSTNPLIAYVIEGYQLEIWRSWVEYGINPYRSFVGFIIDVDITTNDSATLYTIYAQGLNRILDRRIIAYDAETVNRTQFTTVPAETVFKTLVSYNAGANALVANGRDRDAVVTGLTIQADGATGTTLTIACTRLRLLDTLQKYAVSAGGDFAIVKTGATAFDFRWYLGQLGTDRSSGANKLIFSLDRSNMRNPRLSIRNSTLRTVAIVGGTGVADARSIRTVTSTLYTATNDNEVFVNGANGGVSSNAMLDQLGTTELANYVANYATLSYVIIQTPIYAAERDYFLGDKVVAQYQGVNQINFIQTLAFSYRENSPETVQVGTALV